MGFLKKTLTDRPVEVEQFLDMNNMVKIKQKGQLKMTNLVPLEKKSKKEQREFHLKQRGHWYGINPVSRVVPDKKKYNRKKLSKKFDSFEHYAA